MDQSALRFPDAAHTLVSLASFLALTANTHAEDIVRGRELANSCTVCHAADGDAVNPTVPKLAGQNDLYLIKAMKDYRDRKRLDASMNAIFRNMPDDDIKDLAAWFSSIPVSIGK